MRRAGRTTAGTTLVAIQDAGLLLELDASGGAVRKLEFPHRMPAMAMPLDAGGMLLGLAGPGEVRRIDASGKTVMTFAGRTMLPGWHGLPVSHQRPRAD